MCFEFICRTSLCVIIGDARTTGLRILPSVPLARMGNSEILTNANVAEICISPRFNPERHLNSCINFKLNRAAALAEWRQLLSA